MTAVHCTKKKSLRHTKKGTSLSVSRGQYRNAARTRNNGHAIKGDKSDLWIHATESLPPWSAPVLQKDAQERREAVTEKVGLFSVATYSESLL